MTEREVYIRTVLELYAGMPDIAFPARRTDRAVARAFYDQQIPVDIIEAALLMGSARRICRPKDAMPLPPIRSLHYFKPVVEEVAAKPLPHDYIPYLRLKIQMACTPVGVDDKR